LATFGTWDYFVAAPLFNPAAVPGRQRAQPGPGGIGGRHDRQAIYGVYGGIPIDGIEIDPGIVAVGRQYFDMNEPNLNVIVQDGRWALAHSRNTYSVIGVDAYRLPYIPWKPDDPRVLSGGTRSPHLRWRAGDQCRPHLHRPR
jgi:hypothetical protein